MAKKKKNRKLEVVFDPNSRREFLTGFRKRKNERKKRAKEELDALLKIERKRIRQEVKDSVKHLKKSFEPIPEIQHLIDQEEEYEDSAVKVRIVDISSDITSYRSFIGKNNQKQSQNTEDSGIYDEETTEDVPGMSTSSRNLNSNQKNVNLKPISSKKDLNRITKKTAFKSMKKNKLFKMKSKLDKVADRKKASKERRKREKFQTQQEKRKVKFRRK